MMMTWISIGALIFSAICFLSGGLASRLGYANARKNRHRWLCEQHEEWRRRKREPFPMDAKAAFAEAPAIAAGVSILD